MPHPKPLVLIILDGWGYRAETKANAIALARKPIYDRMLREYPNTLIHTSGPFVGLPEGQMGNSEVGHLNIGAGRIVHMDITRIEVMIQNGDFFSHPVLLDAMKHAPQSRAGGLAGTLGPQQRGNDVPCNGALGLREIDQQRKTLAQVQLDRVVVTVDLREPERLKREPRHEIPPCPIVAPGDAQGTVQ